MAATLPYAIRLRGESMPGIAAHRGAKHGGAGAAKAEVAKARARRQANARRVDSPVAPNHDLDRLGGAASRYVGNRRGWCFIQRIRL